MSSRTNRQLAAYALHQAFLVDFVADLEQRELDSESDSSKGLTFNDGNSGVLTQKYGY